jgi:gentisate 1,2-dioxygenase
MTDLATPDSLAVSASLEELYRKLAPLQVGPGWNKPTPSLWPLPRASFLPAHWSYAQAHGALEAAGRLINTELAERRNLILINPLPGNEYATARTLVAAYQMIMPGERARSHRHSANALRLVLDAEPGTSTVVDGVELPMSVGDVLLTPNWRWHGHANNSGKAAYWLDFLDVPLIHLLEPMFLEQHPDVYEPVSEVAETSLAWFPWRDTASRLDAAAPEPTGRFGTQIELGDPAMTTIALHMMRLEPGRETTRHQTTASNIYAVVEGEGETEVDGTRFRWSRGDVVVAPAWRPHHHKARTPSVLLRVSDEPVLRKLDLLRAAVAPGDC